MMALVSEEDGDFGAASALRMGGGLGARGALHSPSAAQAPSPPVLASLGASLSPPAAARGLASGSATRSLGCLASPPPPLAAGDGGGGDDDDADVCGDLQPRLLLLPAADDAAAGAAAAGGGYEPPHSRSVSAALGAALAMRLDLAAGAGDNSDGGAELGMRMPVSPVALCSVREGANSSGCDDGLSPATYGSVIALNAVAGQEVRRGDLLLVIESMKMETAIFAGLDGVVREVHVQIGQTFDRDAVLVSLEPSGRTA